MANGETKKSTPGQEKLLYTQEYVMMLTTWYAITKCNRPTNNTGLQKQLQNKTQNNHSRSMLMSSFNPLPCSLLLPLAAAAAAAAAVFSFSFSLSFLLALPMPSNWANISMLDRNHDWLYPVCCTLCTHRLRYCWCTTLSCLSECTTLSCLSECYCCLIGSAGKCEIRQW